MILQHRPWPIIIYDKSHKRLPIRAKIHKYVLRINQIYPFISPIPLTLLDLYLFKKKKTNANQLSSITFLPQDFRSTVQNPKEEEIYFWSQIEVQI